MRFKYPNLLNEEKSINTKEEYFAAGNVYFQKETRKAELNKIGRELKREGKTPDTSLIQEFTQISKDLEEIKPAFFRRNPTVLLSICPICKFEVWQSIGVFSLNHNYWYQASRSGREVNPGRACPHLFCISGALHLNGHSPTEQKVPPNATQLFIQMAAEEPFVIPRLLNLSGMTAVIHQIQVSEKYTAFPICYFAENLPAWDQHFALPWASTKLDGFIPKDGKAHSFTGKREESRDFDLKKWVDAGKLKWVEPEHELDLASSPMANLPQGNNKGRRGPYRIEKGSVEKLSPVTGKSPEVIWGDLVR